MLHECKEKEMKNQTEVQNEQNGSSCNAGTYAFLLAGLGIGTALSLFLAPKSGLETREWIATKCLDGVDAANEKVRQARILVHEIVDQGQQKISEAVSAGRETIGKEKSAAEVKAS
jgi:gas vesicle protein